jgi:ABC-type multidrug transport system fused ATPase/permease subunit
VTFVTSADLGRIGIGLLVVSAVLILFELTLMSWWTVRVARRSRMLSEKLLEEQAQLRADVERLYAAIEETRALWQPYRRILRWLRHPITLAVIRQYTRGRTAR